MNVFAPGELSRLGTVQHAELFSGSTQVGEALAPICVAIWLIRPSCHLM